MFSPEALLQCFLQGLSVGIRYSVATFRLSKGVHTELVQELPGYADITTILNAYSHVIPSTKGRTPSAMEDLLRDDDEE